MEGVDLLEACSDDETALAPVEATEAVAIAADEAIEEAGLAPARAERQLQNRGPVDSMHAGQSGQGPTRLCDRTKHGLCFAEIRQEGEA